MFVVVLKFFTAPLHDFCGCPRFVHVNKLVKNRRGINEFIHRYNHAILVL